MLNLASSEVKADVGFELKQICKLLILFTSLESRMNSVKLNFKQTL